MRHRWFELKETGGGIKMKKSKGRTSFLINPGTQTILYILQPYSLSKHIEKEHLHSLQRRIKAASLPNIMVPSSYWRVASSAEGFFHKVINVYRNGLKHRKHFLFILSTSELFLVPVNSTVCCIFHLDLTFLIYVDFDRISMTMKQMYIFMWSYIESTCK